MFKNAFIYTITGDIPKITDEELRKDIFTECASNQESAVGWSPLIKNSSLEHTINDCTLINLRLDEKIMPASIVKKITDERVEAIEVEEQRKLSKNKRESIKYEVIFELLPRALTKTSFIKAYIDRARGIVVVNGSSPGKCEILLSQLRKTLSTLPVKPLSIDGVQPELIMTEWMKGSLESDKLKIANGSIDITFGDTEQASARLKNIDRESSQFLEHIQSGGLVTKMDIAWNEALAVTLKSSLSLHKVKWIDIEDVDGDYDDEASRMDAEFALLSGTLGNLYDDLIDFLKVNTLID